MSVGHRALENRLRALPLDGVAPLGQIVDGLGDAFALNEVVVQRVIPAAAGLAVELWESRGMSKAARTAYQDVLVGGPRSLLYNPMRPDAWQRNRVVSGAELLSRNPSSSAAAVAMLERMNLDMRGQTRVLVCDGPLLLAWVGGFRSRPLAPSERRFFESVLPMLRAALALDRTLRDARVAAAGLAAALEEIAVPSFVARRGGAIEHANESGRGRFDRAPGDTTSLLGALIEAFEAGRPTDGVTRLGDSSTSERWLIVLRHYPPSFEPLDRAGVAWGLTPRQLTVLRCIARGDANKTIAHRLGCAEGTIEAHATAIFRKAGVDGRSGLMAKLLGGGW